MTISFAKFGKHPLFMTYPQNWEGKVRTVSLRSGALVKEVLLCSCPCLSPLSHRCAALYIQVSSIATKLLQNPEIPYRPPLISMLFDSRLFCESEEDI